MKLTQAMSEAEIEREAALDRSHRLLEIASMPTHGGVRADNWLLEESIRNLMVGSHSGRIGL